MSRRLNSQLFEENTSPQVEEAPGYSAIASEKVNLELRDIKKTVSHLESMVEVLQSRLGQISNNGDKRSEVFSKALSELEKTMKHQNSELLQKTDALEEHFVERKEIDHKIENMVDRFNTSLSHFENKLSSLQKVISEKEMALMSYRSIIEKIVDEVEKLKSSRL